MKMSVRSGRLAAVLLIAAVGLSACGSGNDNDPGQAGLAGQAAQAGQTVQAGQAPAGGAPSSAPVTTGAVPASAGTSVQGYIAFLRGLKTDETSLPLALGMFTPPIDDSAAATPLDS